MINGQWNLHLVGLVDRLRWLPSAFSAAASQA
jgi:hypothetical protein